MFNKNINFSDLAQNLCKSKSLIFVSEVGQGAFKKTYHVRNLNGNDIALKVIMSANGGLRTEREINAMLTCDHPNVARILEISTFDYMGDTFPFLLEDFYGGGTLEDQLKNYTAVLDPDYIYDIGITLIEALTHIWSHNFVHRDIKPANIIFRNDHTPVITDFGLVRDLSATSLTQTFLPQGPGTPLFSSPEQLRNEKAMINWRTDQFSLGITFSICLFGYHPYSQKKSFNDNPLPSVANRNPVPNDFLQTTRKVGLPVIFKMVSPWVVERYPSPKYLLDEWTVQRRK